MTTAEENVHMLSRAILGEAEDETKQLKAEAQSKADGIRQRAQVQADRERQVILERAAQEADRLRSQAIATAQLKARAAELQHREQLLEQVFDGVKQQLSSVIRRKDYDQIAVHFVRETVEQLRAGKAEIRADKVTQKVLTPQLLEKLSKELHTELLMGKTLEQGTGVVVQAADGHLNFDNTLETRLARLRGALRSDVYQVLMGESE
jgi:vacuolar-type H+-ATPase subunit E/Vma4